MINYSRLAIPVIAIPGVGGVISFFLAYNLYPEKHVNVTIDGSCYELLDDAHQQYVNLAAKNDIEKLRLQLSKVEQKDASIPIIFTGRDSDIADFRNRYQLSVTSQQKIKYFPNIDASVATANISKNELANILGNLTLNDVYPSAKTVAGSVGIEPNNYITPAEGKDVSIKLNEYMNNGN